LTAIITRPHPDRMILKNQSFARGAGHEIARLPTRLTNPVRDQPKQLTLL
jgi:hypothetical protein